MISVVRDGTAEIPDEQTQLKASYSRRIRRPGTQELNPFPVFFDQQNVFLGNPTLKSEFTDAFELGLTKSGQLGSVQLSPFYRHTSDVIRVNLNTASANELETLPGIGKGLAERIIEHRQKYGSFRRPEHLIAVRGISDRRFRALRELITVE